MNGEVGGGRWNHTFVWTYVIGGGDGKSQRQAVLMWGQFSWESYSEAHNDLEFLV